MVRKSTKGTGYAELLKLRSGKTWKKVLDVQRPYRWNLRRLDLGRTLDVGCGIGRNLRNLPAGSVGVDHNKYAIKEARYLGLEAYTTDEFKKVIKPKKNSKFDSMLLAHVLEHMNTSEGKKIIKEYLPYVREKVVVICPQEKGFKSDDTHVNFLDHKGIEDILTNCGLDIDRSYSFPFPRFIGRVFRYNETVVVGKVKQVTS